MVKKSIFAIALMGLLATVATAGDFAQNPWKFDNGWPKQVVVTYEEKEICQIPVFIDVGHYVELEKCNERKINLVQVNCTSIGKTAADFPCYRDCETFRVRANFEVQLGATLYKNSPTVIEGTKYNLYFTGSTIIPPTGAYTAAEICLELWGADIFNVPVDYNQAIAEVAITVKPTGIATCP